MKLISFIVPGKRRRSLQSLSLYFYLNFLELLGVEKCHAKLQYYISYIKKVTRINKAKKLSVSFSTSQGMYTEIIFKFHKPYSIFYSKQNSKVCSHFL